MTFSSQSLAWHTEAGRRSNNEDSCATAVSPDGTRALLVVADGMGGHACGEVASRLVVESLLRDYSQNRFDVSPEFLRNAIARAHHEVLHASQQNAAQKGMGATVVVAILDCGDENAKRTPRGIVGHVGDSRAYQFRSDYVRRLTSDHLMVVEALGYDEERAKNHPRGNELSQAMGSGNSVNPTISEFDLCEGDAIVLCTDGVSEVLSAPQMHSAIQRFVAVSGEEKSRPDSLAHFCASVVKHAIESGSRDNCTVAVALAPALAAVAPQKESHSSSHAQSGAGSKTRELETAPTLSLENVSLNG